MVKKMKKLWLQSKKIMPLIPILLLTLTAMFVKPTYAQESAGKIFLSPSSTSWTTLTHKVDDTFTLEVRITNVTECFLIVFSLQWNDTAILLTNVAQGNVLEPGTSFMLAPDYTPVSAGGTGPNDTIGGVVYTKLGAVHGVNIQPPSSGLVATLTFKAVSSPPAGFPLSTDISFIDTVDYPTRWTTSPYAVLPNTEYMFATMSPSVFRFEGIYTTITQIVADGQTFYVAVKSNSSTTTPVFSKVSPSGGSLTFNVTGAPGTAGFSNVTIPIGLMWGVTTSWLIMFDGSPITGSIAQNSTHTSVSIPYTHSPHTIEIIAPNAIPEFPAVALLPIFMAVILFATLLTMKSNSRKRRSPAI